VLHSTNGDAALAASNYDEAIELYSAAIDLGSASDSNFANRSKARLEKIQWEDALVDALKVRWYLSFGSQFSFRRYTGHRPQSFV
jgi:hypothetical protein